ncbi:U3 small nucleolar RNA-associated protein 18 homolog wicked [Nomia melanderi]|uniref:U3 small nucleolar RNA-associated protein 18 homolog wicked n=1 Tax=Nomia melanderi TaxID=2448451 RepID=UPI0013046B42|nr:U3 small nucleolar RNA-associated protein 18 homolog [Nomia melanderi]
MSKVIEKKHKMTTQKSAVHKKSAKKRMSMKTLYDPKFTVPLHKKRRNEYDPKEEARLERIVFGDPSDIINNLLNDEDELDANESVSVNNHDNDSDVLNVETVDATSQRKIAWIDEEDEQYSARTAAQLQNRRLPARILEKSYKDILHTKHSHLVGTPKWATLKNLEEDKDDLDTEILKHSCHLEKPKVKNLPKSVIDIKALNLINKETHFEGPIISSVEFHPSSTVALVAGTSGTLSLFQVDGIENNKLHSMQYKKFPINVAKFLRDGTEVLIGSKYYPYCHSYNLMSGKTRKIPLPHGVTNMPNCEVSPDGKLLAFCGRLGEIYLLTSSSKELIGTLKMNARCRAVCFTPDSKSLITHGDGSEMYVWDVNSRSCIHRAIDDGCLSCASIAVSPSGQFLATGSKEGVVNLYDTKTVLQSKDPVPLKIFLNLVTSVTSLKFNSYSEILAMASDKKNNAFKMAHLPSFTVFSNFPTLQTNLTMPEAINFSPGSGYLGISNRSGSAFLYRLKHYGNY